MFKQYCFDIAIPKDVDLDDPTRLKKYVKSLYVGDGKFSKDSVPLIVLFVRVDNNVCVRLKTKGAKNIDLIEKINKNLSEKQLEWNGLQLSRPYEFLEGEQTWWHSDEAKRPKKPGERWVSIVQQGPYFTHIYEPYVAIGGQLMYDGVMYDLTPTEEEIAMLYARRLLSEENESVVVKLTKDTTFNNNFWSGFQKYLTKEHKKIFKKFSKIGWKNLVSKAGALKEKKPTEEEKELKLIRNSEKKRTYGYALLDGKREQVGNFTVEPVGLYMGHGKHPFRGKIKGRINPEDVTLNLGEHDPVPSPPPGHRWGKIIHDHKVVWLAKWQDSIMNAPKYVQFAAAGKFKGESDLSKFEKARKLQRHIDAVRDSYMNDAESTDNEKMQLGTVLWLIDHHGIRPGGEKGDEHADTVGASTLQVGHVKLLGKNTIKFDFLGKDSVKFEKEMKVPRLIYSNFEKLITGRAKNAQVFNLISAASMNDYLKRFDSQFSNKVFRTRLASYIMFEALQKVNIPKGPITKKQVKIAFNKANIKVAEVLNHTRTISIKAKKALKKLQTEMKELRSDLKQAKKDKIGEKKIAAIEKKIRTKQDNITAKSDTMAVAISTSLTNYIDPRLVVAWARKQASKVPKDEVEKRFGTILSAVYTTALTKKFQWAIQSPYVTADWSWLDSPLQDSSGLKPGEPSIGKKTKKKLSKTQEPRVSKTDLNAWCRDKYGRNWWRNKKKERLEEARRALASAPPPEPPPSSSGSEPPPPEPPPSSSGSEPPPPEPPTQLDEKDYKILLEVCQSQFKKFKDLYSLTKVKDGGRYTYPALEWLSPFTLYAVEHNKGNIRICRLFNRLYKELTTR